MPVAIGLSHDSNNKLAWLAGASPEEKIVELLAGQVSFFKEVEARRIRVFTTCFANGRLPPARRLRALRDQLTTRL
jgi:hypothetical protein